ncbi:MAG TPA: hypothetical protein DD979_05590 [Gammaproteobacteria bacterium]|jgi:hypothetical protein|nr:hypothetical protein [Gammaproteobacteria bacterium]
MPLLNAIALTMTRRPWQLAAVVVAIVAVILWRSALPPLTPACRLIDDAVAVCAASDMAKLPDHGGVPLTHSDFAIAEGPLRLHAARNATVGFQLLLQNRAALDDAHVAVSVSALTSVDGDTIPPQSTELFLAGYHHVSPGGYTWGPKSEVLPWPERYPDVLIPQQSSCTDPELPLFEQVSLSQRRDALQAMWVDIYIPKDQPAGVYRGAVEARLSTGTALDIPVALTVWSATLPDKPSFDAVGEVYIAYAQEGAGMDLGDAAWRRMAHCYQQLAHRHRMVFIERFPTFPVNGDWAAYDAVYDPILSGRLFTPEYGYHGPGESTPVTVWRTPWPQEVNGQIEAPLSDETLAMYQQRAAAWQAHVRARGWEETDYFAYILDEVDGPMDTSDEAPVQTQAALARRDYLAMAHDQMRRLQAALDAGAGDGAIDLLWTSHADASRWRDDPELDLSGVIRWWAPNAGAATPAFFAERQRQNEKIWFYHDGHPAVGVHSINASGIEMRTWGVIGARYGFDGQLMWAVNLGSMTQPFAKPSYKDADDRFGNGVLVYPGAQLDQLGFRPTPGPLPSMRMKAWRRGLQDAELARLAAQSGHAEAAHALLRQMVPRALGEGVGKAAWPTDPGVWIDWHQRLLALASNGTRTADDP